MQAADEPIDLLITDVVMPQARRPALIREVRERYPGMKVIFISGYAEDDFRESSSASPTSTSCPSRSASTSSPARSRK